jgi:predicted nucleic acid-binding protein
MENKKIILDSCVWIAFFHKEDSQHEKAQELISITANEIIIPEYVVLEVSTVLQNKKLKQMADNFLSLIFDQNSTFTFLPSQNFLETKDVFQNQEKNLAFVDCSLVALSKDYQILTFDTALERYIAEH